MLKQFSDKIRMNGKSLGNENGSGNWLKDSYHKIKWTRMKEEVAIFRDNEGRCLGMF